MRPRRWLLILEESRLCSINHCLRAKESTAVACQSLDTVARVNNGIRKYGAS